MYKDALETVNRVQAQMGGISTLDLFRAYRNGRVALSREEADDFEHVFSAFGEMFAPVEA
jgi:hypothetical protein